MTPTPIIIIIIILVILVILSIVWVILAKKKLDECRNTESMGCTLYYCAGSDKNTGTPCTEALATKQYDSTTKAEITIPGPNVAFRYNKNGELMCQSYPNNYNAISNWNGVK